MDSFSKEVRSQIMRCVKSKNTTPELLVRKMTYQMGFRYRLHRKDIPGSPDLAFIKRKKVIFVHGCFWHGHERCKRATLPQTNHDYWESKIKRNSDRDSSNLLKLEAMGWSSLIIWECELKEVEKVKLKIKCFLLSN